MNTVIRYSMCVVMLILAGARAAIAQDLVTISGVVTPKADGIPIPGAIVSVVGAGASATTDAGGRGHGTGPRARVRGNRIQLRSRRSGCLQSSSTLPPTVRWSRRTSA